MQIEVISMQTAEHDLRLDLLNSLLPTPHCSRHFTESYDAYKPDLKVELSVLLQPAF